MPSPILRPKPRPPFYRPLFGGVIALLILGVVAWCLSYRPQSTVSNTASPVVVESFPAPLSRWPWPRATRERRHRGVQRWRAAQPDGTLVELLEFDFAANPGLRWEIADQDADDAQPFDNRVEFTRRNAPLMVRGLNVRLARTGAGRVVAAWNGAFFGYDRKTNAPIAFHVAPVVLGGKVFYTRTNHRWTFGVSYKGHKPTWKLAHLPGIPTMTHDFEWAAGGVQCLVKDGKPLKLQPFPRLGAPPLKQPYPSSPSDAGHIPVFDHMRTSRASLAWNKRGDKLWLLFVKEPDSEQSSALGLKHGASWAGATVTGGWTVADVQRFWQSRRAWCAINSDAGGVAQLLTIRPDGRYDLIAGGAGLHHLTLPADLHTATPSGIDSSIMYFYVRDGGK